MQSVMLWAVLAAIVVGAAATILLLQRVRSQSPLAVASPVVYVPGPATEAPVIQQFVVDHHALAGFQEQIYSLAFGVPHLRYPLPGPHEAVLAHARALCDAAVAQRQYLPRRPLLMPQLMKLMNDASSSRRALTGLILQDPVLAGDVLKTANSSYYRVARPPVESVDQALAMLGTNGLRHVVSGCILRPVFQAGDACFPSFSNVMWDLACRTGAAAAAYAQITAHCDRAPAQLGGLLTALGPLMLFRVVRASYKSHGADLTPCAEVFVTVLEESAAHASQRIAALWDLPAVFQDALYEQINPPRAMSPLGCALYAGRLAASSALLIQHGLFDADTARSNLASHGFNTGLAATMIATAGNAAAATDAEATA